jgi:hypothetical protein
MKPAEPDEGGRSTPRPARQWWRLMVLTLVLVLAAFPASFVVRAKFFPPTFDVASIRATEQFQDSALLERAWALPAAESARRSFSYQSNASTCGPSSLANVFRSFGEQVDEGAALKGTGKCWSGFCFGGLTLDELAQVAQTRGSRRITVLRDLTYDEFLAHLRRSNDRARRYIVNFHRGLLFAKGTGHHSPIGGYLEHDQLVFVLDVNEEYRPWLVDPRRLFAAMDSVDSSSGKKRGLLLVE